jgi:hypothetical protein
MTIKDDADWAKLTAINYFPKLNDEQIKRAQRTVCDRATNNQEASFFLEMLGIKENLA